MKWDVVSVIAWLRGMPLRKLSGELSGNLGPRLRWQAALATRALGRSGLTALAVALAALALQVLYITPGRDAIAEEEAQARSGIAALPAARHPHGAAGDPAAPDRRDLPAASRLGARLEQAFALMAAQGFPVREASYRLTVLGQERLQRLTVELPLAGEYPALRRMLQDLSQEPGLMIEAITLQRRAVGEARVSVRLRFSLLGVAE
ncbi:GspMb/PilO family protein [Cupriavidus sp. CP313]